MTFTELTWLPDQVLKSLQRTTSACMFVISRNTTVNLIHLNLQCTSINRLNGLIEWIEYASKEYIRDVWSIVSLKMFMPWQPQATMSSTTMGLQAKRTDTLTKERKQRTEASLSNEHNNMDWPNPVPFVLESRKNSENPFQIRNMIEGNEYLDILELRDRLPAAIGLTDVKMCTTLCKPKKKPELCRQVDTKN